jgi:hypothetical protein
VIAAPEPDLPFAASSDAAIAEAAAGEEEVPGEGLRAASEPYEGTEEKPETPGEDPLDVLTDVAGGTGGDEMASDLVSPVADVLAPEAPEDLEGRTATAEANTIENAEEGAPTFAPVAAHEGSDPAAELGDAAADLVPEPPEADVAARDGVEECSCDCCLSAKRQDAVISTEWTCMPPSPSMSQEKVACTLDHGFTCALTAYEPAEVFDYHLFCMSHCKTVATEPQTQCVALSDAELVNAKKDGVWVDHMLPAIQEADDPAAAAAALKDPPPTASPQETEDATEMGDIAKQMFGPTGPVFQADLSLGNAQLAAGK